MDCCKYFINIQCSKRVDSDKLCQCSHGFYGWEDFQRYLIFHSFCCPLEPFFTCLPYYNHISNIWPNSKDYMLIEILELLYFISYIKTLIQITRISGLENCNGLLNISPKLFLVLPPTTSYHSRQKKINLMPTPCLIWFIDLY